jgi:hypothetical protein
MIRTFRAFLEFCYTARRSYLTDTHLGDMADALKRFHQYRRIFVADDEDPENKSDPSITLPRQHSMVHYHHLTQSFGAPNGLCSSITESKHIAAVKKPYRRSNHHDAIAQMLLTNQRLSKLAECRRIFHERGLLSDTLLEQACAEADTLKATRAAPPNPHHGLFSGDNMGGHHMYMLKDLDESDSEGTTSSRYNESELGDRLRRRNNRDDDRSIALSDEDVGSKDMDMDMNDEDMDNEDMDEQESGGQHTAKDKDENIGRGGFYYDDELNVPLTGGEDSHRAAAPASPVSRDEATRRTSPAREDGDDDMEEDIPRASTHVFHARRHGE